MVNLGESYRLQFQKGFQFFSDAWFEARYYSQTSPPATDRETGVVTPAVTVLRPVLNMVRDQEKLEELIGVTVEVDETGVIFPALDLTDGVDPVLPNPGDYYLDPDDTHWHVIKVYPDNFRAMWLLHVKKRIL